MTESILCQEIITYKPNRVCNEPSCKKEASCNYAGEIRSRFCSSHKLVNMVNVKTKRCKYENCTTNPTFYFENDKSNLYCSQHKQDGMIHKHKTCEISSCNIHAHYNIKGKKNPKFCFTHKEPNMVNIVTKLCIHENCDKRPAYNFSHIRTPKYCNLHKLETMINVVSKRCAFEGCDTLPSFNFERGKSPKFCIIHKEKDMINVIEKYCEFDGCNIVPCYNYENETRGLFCSLHKDSSMINVIEKRICKTPLCCIRVKEKYEGYCMRCFTYMYPDRPVARNYKTKEFAVVEHIQHLFPEFTWIADKRIKDGCSLRRPDLLLDLGHQVIIIEIDENQHTDYDCSCENKRLMLLSQDIGHRNLVFIRFNPDDYINQHNKKIKSCWNITKETGMCKIANKKEWNNRLDILALQIKYWIENQSDKTIQVIQLFYDEYL